MTFIDVIYKAFDDTLKYKKQLISNMIRSGCPLPPNYNAESKEKFNKILLSIKHINEAMKIVCESYNNENDKLAITNAGIANL